MPGDVPQLQLPEETPRPLPTPFDETRVAPASFGAAVGEGLEQVGAAGAEIAAHAKAKADRTAVLDAIAKSNKAMNDIILDPQNGYRRTKGMDAVERRDDYLGKFQGAVKAAADGLSNGDQRRYFQRYATTILDSGVRHVYTHESEQINETARASAAGATFEGMRTLDNAVAGGNPDDIQQAVEHLWQTQVESAKALYGENAGREAISSVALPAMQNAARAGMQAAIATQDPQVARAALDKLGDLLITAHHRDFSAAVSALQRKQHVAEATHEMLAGASDSVPVPGGDPIARLNAAKVAAGLAALGPDDPQREDITKAVELQQSAHDKVWDQAVAQVVQRVQSAGTDPATGMFAMASPQVSAADKVWLQKNAPEKLIALSLLDARESRQQSAAERAEARTTSATNYSAAVSWLHDDDNRAEVLKMSRAEFGAQLLDDSQYPDGLSPQDRTKALAEFDKVTKAGTKLDEAVRTTVTWAIEKAAGGNLVLQKQLDAKYRGDLLDKANATYAGNKTIGTEALRKYVETELAKGSVTGAGALSNPLFSTDRGGVRRVEWEKSNEFGWRPFVTENGETIPGHPVRMTKGGKTKLVQPDQVEAVLGQGATFAP